MYVVGEATGRHAVPFREPAHRPVRYRPSLSDMFGSAPKTVMEDHTVLHAYHEVEYDPSKAEQYIEKSCNSKPWRARIT